VILIRQNVKQIALFAVVLLAYSRLSGQNGCSALGQTPSTAFPVCGTSVFIQDTVPLCEGTIIPCLCNYTSGIDVTDINPYYYKFTCFKGGTLAFTVAPNNSSDDYDWQLFDITGQNPNNIYTDTSLFVACDWSGSSGNTGASSTGVAFIECPSDPTVYENTFSKLPTLIVGHTYLLLVSHFTQTQSGYSLAFGGGSAVITDTTQPALLAAQASGCGSSMIKIGLNKNMLCTSLASDGSDFVLTPAGGPAIVSASGDNCNSGFDMDTVTLTFAGAIPQGNYQISVKNGDDGNTLLDICGTPIPVGNSVPLMVPSPPAPVTLDSMAPPGCAPIVLNLVFDKGILCSSVAPDGSDFSVTGPSSVTVSGASCNGDSSRTVTVQLSGPLSQGGTYQLQLKVGSDGNTLIDECLQTIAPATISFTVADTVYAQIQDVVTLGCKYDSIAYSNAGGNGINQWTWTFDDSLTRGGQDQTVVYTVFGQKTARLVVSNGVCYDTSGVMINLGNTLLAKFEATNLLCPDDKAYFTDSSIGSIVSYSWNFGDGAGSTAAVPSAIQYPLIQQNQNYIVSLAVTDQAGCIDTAYQEIQDIANCYIAVPSAFTPNGDGINDYLYPLNAYKAENLEFRVYNRWGNLVFQTEDWTIRWDGTVNGRQEPVGTYIWTLRYTNMETGQKVVQKGTSVLIR
jgi:gliding motility-associated-like protein